MDLILALDAGTSGVRSVAFDRHLQVVDEEYRELTQYFPSPGEVEHDALEIARARRRHARRRGDAGTKRRSHGGGPGHH